MKKYRVEPKLKITASENATKYWAVNCGFDDGDAESGILVSDFDQIVEAHTPEEAIAKVKELYKGDKSFIGCVDAKDVRPATQLEIEEYEYYDKPGGPGYEEWIEPEDDDDDMY